MATRAMGKEANTTATRDMHACTLRQERVGCMLRDGEETVQQHGCSVLSGSTCWGWTALGHGWVWEMHVDEGFKGQRHTCKTLASQALCSGRDGRHLVRRRHAAVR